MSRMTNNNDNNEEEEYDEEYNKKDNINNYNSGVNFLIPNRKTVTVTATVPSPSMKMETKRRKPAVNIRARGPQFSLADWQRLVHSAKDLAQQKGRPFRKDIPWEEISKHKKEYDCWIVLRGVVYNIGPYLPYHPGGMEIFHNAKNILGNPDSTRADTLFDKYHRGGVYHRGNVTESDVDFLIKAYQDISVPIKFIGAVSTGDYIDSER
ncbi:hypothetical protein FRACYDRAFT_261004 [Fragilariopsis cylindrus CCMP1102]|uniref:Cytochrome b5 heme-binding domain-containing protein n=1 Tax=Fragilariopsis cylindrus CCMP1102 TaxID=635003 RepID=A0A1E7FI21_9STRA|nr:hypothetical protein FRACYDRAFT_261004 [Fragilariopsis cylindrus CCMP1102]|eukprot:OEU17822.1 hypothetical protein FRACYDRAFT_261004 [Fragilariopsis cylindrus CCMP1102]